MSAGAFERVNYEMDNDDITLIQIQPETQSLAIGGSTNTAVAGVPNPNLPFATASKGRRTSGIHARLIRFKFLNTVPDGYKEGSTISLPLLNKTIYLVARRGVVGQYSIGGTAYDIEITGKTAEAVN